MARVKDKEYRELLLDDTNDAFRAGVIEGYKLVKGSISFTPPFPRIKPVPIPAGSTAFREGLKAGIEEAKGKIIEEK